MTTLDYWQECLAHSFEEHGISATEAQIAAIARDVEVSSRQQSMAFGAPESPYPGEIKQLKRELSIEREKVVCRECNGRGSIQLTGVYHSSISRCDRCAGEGRHSP